MVASGLAAICVITFVLALANGAVAIPPGKTLHILIGAIVDHAALAGDRDALVLLDLRLPRVLLGLEVGAALAASGALMQGLFRNPLADPGLIGVSSGAALAAAATIVLGDRLLAGAGEAVPFALLPIGAFCGGLITTLLIYAIATRAGRTSMATMLLAGVALSAFAGAATSLLAFLSDDRQLRDLTFWSLGSLNGASWNKTAIVAAIVTPLLLAAPLLGRALNALALGEAEAFHLGIRVQRIKAATILLVALAVGASVAAAGVVGFVGVVAPHIVRLATGPDHRRLLPLAMMLGGALLVAADAFARVLAAPAELPLGVLTATIGSPFFLWLLLRRNRSVWS
ncbi:iron ABC transporter [Methylosinus sp. 3S-1]|nr:iron ABC transporter [Methylosinus sp. 3S-1]